MGYREAYDDDSSIAEMVRHAALPLQGTANDYKTLIETIGDAHVVLIGEASHGTHEFYRERARITQQLISKKGFNAVAVEADWPDSYEINRYVRHYDPELKTAEQALHGFKRFPQWMWRNIDVMNFVTWLRSFNDGLPAQQKIGFYGLDLYSMHASMHAVISYLDKIDPQAANEARQRYACFDRFDKQMQGYGFMALHGLEQSCEDEVVKQLQDLCDHAWEYSRRDGQLAEEAFFNAEQNARLARNAEKYYRSMFQGRVESWNLRDTHMFETLECLMQHLKRDESAKLIVWAHNSHVGNAQATEMGQWGELNIGQLTQQKFKAHAFSIGFSTYTGTVTAASGWDAPAECKQVRKGLSGSYEALFHQVGIPNYMLILRGDEPLSEALRGPRLERAIGVIYSPLSERQSHYFDANLPQQFDALIHFDKTQAVVPVERTPQWERGEEVSETFPSGL
ncbi:MAG: erythromycin esterase family protein [Candidatus Nitrosoglobus sp.]|jgi:erythromycin esterase-like protein